MKIFYPMFVTILISLCLLPGLVLANSDDSVVQLPDSPDETFFTPLIFPFDLLSPYERVKLMDHATPDLWYIPIPNPEYWVVPVPEEQEPVEFSEEYIYTGQLTVPGPGPHGPRMLIPGFIAGPDFTLTNDMSNVPPDLTMINAFRNDVAGIVL